MIIKLLLFIESVKVKSIMILLVRDFLYKSVYHALVSAITLNNISYLKEIFSTIIMQPRKTLAGFSWGRMVIVLKGSF